MNFIYQFSSVNKAKTAPDVGKFHREEARSPYQFILAIYIETKMGKLSPFDIINFDHALYLFICFFLCLYFVGC